LRAGASPPLKPRDVTCPPSLLVRSGRRIGAGPGHQASAPEGLGRALAAALLAVLCTALMVSPALLATLSTVFVGRLHLQTVPWVEPLKGIPVLEAGRLLVTVALVTKVIRTKELE